MRALIPLTLLILACQNKVTDKDGDGFFGPDDCDDSNPDIHINATEVCNGIDDDCDGQIDAQDRDIDPSGLSLFYADNDGDGFGGRQTIMLCEQVGTFVTDSSDCDDSNANVYPGSSNEPGELCVLDLDGDGYGEVAPPEPYDAGTDCNDTESTIYPSAPEACDDIDSDCDGLDDTVDPDTPTTEILTLFRDSDGDGYGDPLIRVQSCELIPGYCRDNSDCNDSDANIHPAAIEVCDGIDNDCSDLTPETGLVSRWTNGIFSDESAAAASGTANSPFSLDLTDPTLIHFCEGSYDVQLASTDSLSLLGFGAAVLSGGEAHNILNVEYPESNIDFVFSGLTFTETESVAGSLFINGEDAENITVAIDNCLFENNTCYAGCGLIANNIEAAIEHTDFINNGASIGGGLYLLDSNLSLDHVLFDGNTTNAASAILVSDSTISMNNTLLTNNESSSGTIGLDESLLTCNGSQSADLGLHNNSGFTAGVLLSTGAELISNDCDFGDLGSSTDNAGFDIGIAGGIQYYAGDNATFSCANGACGSSTSTPLGPANTWRVPSTCPVEAEMIGTLLTIEDTPTIDSFSIEAIDFLPCPSNEITAAVFKENGNQWDLIWSNTFEVTALNGTLSSGAVGRAFQTGDRIALVFYGNMRLEYGFALQGSTTYPNLGSWNGDRILGQYCTDSCQFGGDVGDLITNNGNIPAMTVSHTNLP